jgi:branched-chain amino acid transport system substrate-binding protein
LRSADHQLTRPLHVSVMQESGDGDVRFGNEGSGFGFKIERYIAEAARILPTTCYMVRPLR